MHSIFQEHAFCYVKKKRQLDLQICSHIDKTVKKLHGIPNTIGNTIVPVIDNVYIFDNVKTDLSTHGLRNI